MVITYCPFPIQSSSVDDQYTTFTAVTNLGSYRSPPALMFKTKTA
jgi:hypothetical protein